MQINEKSVWQLCLEIAVDMEVLSSLPTTTRAKAEKIKAHLGAYLEAATPPEVAGLAELLERQATGHDDLRSNTPNSLLRQAATALRLSAGGGWRTMESAPELDRVIVAGRQKPTRSCAGYWWMHEDVIINGQPDEHPDALLWHPFPSRPAGLPASPTVEAGHVE